MSVRLDRDRLYLEGNCGVEDAEPLVAALEGGGVSVVDISLCRQLHSAVVQALLGFGPPLEGHPAEPFLNDVVLPALTRAMAAVASSSSDGRRSGTTALDMNA